MAETQELLATKKTPSDFLKGVLGRPVDVKLNNGVKYKGVLACLDGYMNIAMEQTQEYQNGQLKAQYGDCFIRGNNGQSIMIKEKILKRTMCGFKHMKVKLVTRLRLSKSIVHDSEFFMRTDGSIRLGNIVDYLMKHQNTDEEISYTDL
ncbi:hypothetical protein DD237_007745 [Peronospora effusa]|uniref:Sm domain-containing protein n=1 Tax=Peronospora effusa TaxID=542832 RepID=A0A425C4L3_9STRA|nr:hypothetical protein DD237_007745 [Peronospora effusa]